MNQTISEISDLSDFDTSANIITKFTNYLLRDIGVSENWIHIVNLLLLLAVACLVVFLLQKLVNWVLTFFLKRIEKITHLSFFKHAVKNRLPHFLALVIPYTFVINAIPTIFEDYRFMITPLKKLTDIYMVLMVIWTFMSVIKSFANVLQEKPSFHNKPMKSYLQVLQIIFYLFGAVAIYSILTGKSAAMFFTAMGAASAVLMLMFKDTIMGFVSSIQLSNNQMVLIGDWITMSKYGADGTVKEINLTTVKIQNFDNTITTIPTYALISDSFQNWRGMQESGGRRIARALIVRQADIHPLSSDELARFAAMRPLNEYITRKNKEYDIINKQLNLDPEYPLKGFQLTNVDLFVHYAEWFLQQNPHVHQDMTLLVRQQAPSLDGLPLQVYCFAKTTTFLGYEEIVGEIFSHLISVVPVFGLTIFENSSSADSLTVNIKQDTIEK